MFLFLVKFKKLKRLVCFKNTYILIIQDDNCLLHLSFRSPPPSHANHKADVFNFWCLSWYSSLHFLYTDHSILRQSFLNYFRKITKVLAVLKMCLLLLLLSRFSRVRLCAIPYTAAHQAPQSLGFSGQEQWSGLPFPSPMQESEK